MATRQNPDSPKLPTDSQPQRYWDSDNGGEESFTKWLAGDPAHTTTAPLQLGSPEPYLASLEDTLGIRLLELTPGETICNGDHELDITGTTYLGRTDAGGHAFTDIVIEAQFDQQNLQYWYQHLGQLLTYDTVSPGRDTSQKPPSVPGLAIWLVETDPNPSFRKALTRLNEQLSTTFVLAKVVVDERTPKIRFDIELPNEPSIGTVQWENAARHKFWTELTHRIHTTNTNELTAATTIPDTRTYKIGSAIPEDGALLRFHLNPPQDSARCYVKLNDRPDLLSQIQADEIGPQRLRHHIGMRTDADPSFHTVRIEHPPDEQSVGDITHPRLIVSRTEPDLNIHNPRHRTKLQNWFVQCGDTIAETLPNL